MTIKIPNTLSAGIGRTKEGAAWIATLAHHVSDASTRWGLAVAAPFIEEASCSWVAPCQQSNGAPAVLKISFPSPEALHEIDGLVFWNADPTVRLIAADKPSNAMLLEQCQPGTSLRACPEPEQDDVIASILRALWRSPDPQSVFRPLSDMIALWTKEAEATLSLRPDQRLALEGLQLYRELSSSTDTTLLATDLHAGNVLKARRAPWLMIDPKPYIGDPCYDATQHLLNCRGRLAENSQKMISDFANQLGVDVHRVRAWTFARLAVGGSGDEFEQTQQLARAVSLS